MFVQSTPSVPYTAPWCRSLDQRLAQIERHPRRIAYYYPRLDDSTFRYRVYNMIQALEACTTPVSAAYFIGDEIDALAEIVGRLDALVLARVPYSDAVAHLIARARSRQCPVLYDIDDMVFDVDDAVEVAHAIDRETEIDATWDSHFAMIARHGAVLRLCDGAIATTEALADRIRAYTGGPCAVVPNFLNREQLAVSNTITEAKVGSGFARDGTTTIGYFSGSPTHNKDFAIVAPALAHLMRRRPEVRLRVTGYIPTLGPLSGLEDRIEQCPFVDFVNLQRLIGEAEINIVPLQNTTFSECKSELKYFEAAAAATVTVASASRTYRGAIRHGKTGYLARSTEWADVLETAVGRMADYATLAMRAHADTIAKYTWNTCGNAILSAVYKDAGRPPDWVAR